MTEDKGILIKNIYYMLSYAFQVLQEREFEQVASEEFDNIADLCAEILVRGVSKQLKQGLYHKYVDKSEEINTVRGRIDIQRTIRLMSRKLKQLHCEYDEYSSDNKYNSILKLTINRLLQCDDVGKSRKKELRSISVYFGKIRDISTDAINWSSLIFDKNNQMYVMLMNICYFVIHDIIMTTDKGTYKMPMFSEKSMEKLYEKFVLNYYKRHHPELQPRSAMIEWDIKEGDISHLPAMLSDIMLYDKIKGRTLIIDTKYYANTLSDNNYGKKIYHTGNIYQIMSYVKNHDKNSTGLTEGMLLYAKTEEEITPQESFVIGKNRYTVRTLDLNKPFKEIAADMEEIIKIW